MALPDGLVVFVKADCPTCVAIAPVLRELREAGMALTVYTQDDPAFPLGLDPVDDTALERSWRAGVEIVPTLVRVEGGEERERMVGWLRGEWESLTGVRGLGAGLPEHRPGCGSRTLDPGMPERLAALYDGERLRSRRVELASAEDDQEAMFARGWSDGLPLVPPTRERVYRMLEGTSRAPDEVVAVVPPDLVECTVEKVAVNAVLAGCRPEYLPAVLAAVEAACTDQFNIHGLLATTWFSGPVVIVNGPFAQRAGMNSGVNALGQGNRANSTIGRALQLVIRNVGGGRPGEVDRATLGNPGKLAFCFAEDEAGSPWEPLAVARGAAPGSSALTLFAGSGVQGIADQLSRTPESLARSFAACLRAVAHPKLALAWDALLVVSPEHGRVFGEAGWDRARLHAELDALLRLPAEEVARGAGGIAEGMPPLGEPQVPKFRPGGLLIAHAGGQAGKFSAVIGGWVSGPGGSEPVTREFS
jgi:hypothetical protein